MYEDRPVRLVVNAPAATPPDPGWVRDLLKVLSDEGYLVTVEIWLNSIEAPAGDTDPVADVFDWTWIYLEAQGKVDGRGGAQHARILDLWQDEHQREISRFIAKHAGDRAPAVPPFVPPLVEGESDR
jgi:hypothetical protein